MHPIAIYRVHIMVMDKLRVAVVKNFLVIVFSSQVSLTFVHGQNEQNKTYGINCLLHSGAEIKLLCALQEQTHAQAISRYVSI